MQFFVHYIDKEERPIKTNTDARSYEELKLNLLTHGADIISIKDMHGAELYLPKMTMEARCVVPMGINPNDTASIEQLALAQMNGQALPPQVMSLDNIDLNVLPSPPSPPSLPSPPATIAPKPEDFLFYNMGATQVRVIKKTGQLQKREWVRLAPADLSEFDIELSIKQKDGSFSNIKEMKDMYISKWINV